MVSSEDHMYVWYHITKQGLLRRLHSTFIPLGVTWKDYKTANLVEEFIVLFIVTVFEHYRSMKDMYTSSDNFFSCFFIKYLKLTLIIVYGFNKTYSLFKLHHLIYSQLVFCMTFQFDVIPIRHLWTVEVSSMTETLWL